MKEKTHIRDPSKYSTGFSDNFEPLEPLATGWGDALRPLFGLEPGEGAPPPKREEQSGSTLMQYLSPGNKDIVAAIERNIMKPAFDVVVRMCYVAKRDNFSMSHIASFVGALKTYNTQTLNGFRLNSATIATKTQWWLPALMTRDLKNHKKSLYYQYYRARKIFNDTWNLKSAPITLNTEELATIYHYPGLTAKAPLMPRIDTKRSEPPASLPVG